MKWSNSKILICILADFFPSFNAIHLRVMSMIIYVTLRLANISYESVGEIFKELNLNGVSNWVVLKYITKARVISKFCILCLVQGFLPLQYLIKKTKILIIPYINLNKLLLNIIYGSLFYLKQKD